VTEVPLMYKHGETNISIEGIVIRNKPRFISNREGIRRNWAKVLKAASGMDRWILWADAESSFAMTPESLDLIISRMKSLKKYGCIGVAFTLSNPIIPYYANKIKSVMDIPFLASKSVIEIKDFIESLSAEN